MNYVIWVPPMPVPAQAHPHWHLGANPCGVASPDGYLQCTLDKQNHGVDQNTGGAQQEYHLAHDRITGAYLGQWHKSAHKLTPIEVRNNLNQSLPAYPGGPRPTNIPQSPKYAEVKSSLAPYGSTEFHEDDLFADYTASKDGQLPTWAEISARDHELIKQRAAKTYGPAVTVEDIKRAQALEKEREQQMKKQSG
jgi:hypothetical protein